MSTSINECVLHKCEYCSEEIPFGTGVGRDMGSYDIWFHDDCEYDFDNANDIY